MLLLHYAMRVVAARCLLICHGALRVIDTLIIAAADAKAAYARARVVAYAREEALKSTS